jgi:hypothetical protein
MDLFYFDKIASVPLHFARPSISDYGSQGNPQAFQATMLLIDKLNVCFSEIFEKIPYGIAEVITLSGSFLAGNGRHGEGLAVDLDSIFWKNRSFTALNYNLDPYLYLGIESILRKHFGTVLSYLYSPTHHDHIHIDIGTEVGFNPKSKPRVLFLQAALTHIFDLKVTIDGFYGRQTKTAVNELLRLEELNGKLSDQTIWLKLLSRTSERAFKMLNFKREEELSTIAQETLLIIEKELKGHPSKMIIEEAFLRILEHPEIKNLANVKNIKKAKGNKF